MRKKICFIELLQEFEDEALDMLTNCLKYNSEEDKMEIIKILVNIKSDKSIKSLIDFCSDKNKCVSMSAMKGIEEIGKKAVGTLIKELDNNNVLKRGYAKEALRNITGKTKFERVKIVLDTNIFVNSLIMPSGCCSRIIKKWKNTDFTLYMYRVMLEEIDKVIRRPKIVKEHRLKEKKICRYIKYIKNFAVFITPATIVSVIKDDPADNMFLSCAVDAEADYIISMDKHLLLLRSFKRIPIISPGVFWEVINVFEQKGNNEA